MSGLREHVSILRRLLDDGGWLTDRFHAAAALACGAHLPEIEALLADAAFLLARAETAEARIRILEAALEPFARLGHLIADFTEQHGDRPIKGFGDEFIRARSALSPLPGGSE